MSLRPVDIARQLKISTTTLRKYEDMGLVPKTSRTLSGYRIYTQKHLAYFTCCLLYTSIVLHRRSVKLAVHIR